MDEQMAINPWLPDFLQNASEYALWMEVLQYLLLIVLTIAVFTMACALFDLILLLRQERLKTQPLGIALLKSMTRWLDLHVLHGSAWRATAAGIHATATRLQHARPPRFPH